MTTNNTSNIKLNKIMNEYVQDYLSKTKDPDFFGKNGKSYIIGPFPIIWFGSLDKYFSTSKKKIVTIAVNPSNQEFEPEWGQAPRFNSVDFSDYNLINAKEKEKRLGELQETLNSYFYTNPYMDWFNSFENNLNAIGASYKNEKDSEYVVIHIDIYSAIATSPTWSMLEKKAKRKLPNFDLFKKFLRLLDPDIIFFSSGHQAFEKLKEAMTENKSECDLIKEYRKTNNTNGMYQVTEGKDSKEYFRIYKIISKIGERDKFIIWGRCVYKPFSVFSQEARNDILSEWLGKRRDVSKWYTK